MATFYHGYRNIIKGRDSDDSVHPYKGVGEYSNWSLWNTSHALDGAPDSDHTPGTGRHPHDLHMSRVMRGLEDGIQPINHVGEGARIEGMRYRPWENKAAGNNKVFKAGYGHAPGTPVAGEEQYGITDWTFDGVTAKSLSGSFGHTVRYVDAAGTANSFGAFHPNDYESKSITGTPLEDPGVLASSFDISDNATAHKKVNEWRGVPSAKALSI